MTSLRKTSSSSGSSYSSGSSGSASMRSADGPPYAFLLESGPSPSPGLFTPLMVVFAVRSRGLPMFFSNATLSVTLPPVNEAFTVRFESGRGASYIRRFAEVGSLARDSWVGTTPTRARVGLSQRPMEESFHEKVFRYQPNVIIWFSAIQSAGERWREYAGERQRYIKSRRAPAPKEKEVSHRKSCPVPDHGSSARQSLFAQ